MRNMIKKIAAAAFIGAVSCFNVLAEDVAEPAVAPVEESAYAVCEDEELSGCERNFYNMGRGLVNVLTCWLEVPRCLIYHNSQVPVMGVAVGACEGVGFTAVRAFAGVADFCSLGFMTDSIYEVNYDFREFAWESRWIPKNQ